MTMLIRQNTDPDTAHCLSLCANGQKVKWSARILRRNMSTKNNNRNRSRTIFFLARHLSQYELGINEFFQETLSFYTIDAKMMSSYSEFFGHFSFILYLALNKLSTI